MAFMNDISNSGRDAPDRFKRVTFTTQYLHELSLYVLPGSEVLLRVSQAGEDLMLLQFDDDFYAEFIASRIVDWVAENPRADKEDLTLWIKTRARAEVPMIQQHHVY
ncbi:MULTISPECIES: hypothetical protein [Cobetia]|uniref:hypothetical protein n=1 Tax=Cobetia TaxID=204286 RepID=UPI00159651ED|nr:MULTISPECIES: hypothetical protein [unclassified Cobetia]MDA5563370.1 hypothetical protein [Cobetia sp. MMG027]MDH2289764.1 hypothetical protein [Cobetia sp. 10Alg 146]MDN2655989.1 hypothetical protein [Cobetia sp. 14N.309.X.WAT.E.A4]